MDPMKIFGEFADSMLNIQVFHNIEENATKNQMLELDQYVKATDKDHDAYFGSFHNLLFNDLVARKIKSYKLKELNIDEHRNQILLQLNKQTCWLLVDAYEIFKKYLIKIYVYVVFNDSTSLIKSDFNIDINQFKSEDINLWQENIISIVEEKRTKQVKIILSSFRKVYSLFKAIELNNIFDIDMGIIITAIRHLRNEITHSLGKCDQYKLIQKILKDSGYTQNSNQGIACKEFVQSFFGPGDLGNTIMLVDIHSILERSHLYTDKFYRIFQFLISYAVLVCRCVSGKDIDCDS